MTSLLTFLTFIHLELSSFESIGQNRSGRDDGVEDSAGGRRGEGGEEEDEG